jgi:hypothetical protein
MFRRGTVWIGCTLVAALVLTGFNASEARSAFPLGWTVSISNSIQLSRLDLPISRASQVIIIGNEKVGQVRITREVQLYPEPTIYYPNRSPERENQDGKIQNGERGQTAPEASPFDSRDERDFPYVGIEVLREIREGSLLFADPNDPYEYVMGGSMIIRVTRGGEDPILPSAIDPHAISLEWDYPEMLDDVRAIRDHGKLFGGPGFPVFHHFGPSAAVPTPNPRPLIRAPNFGIWHIELLENRTSVLLLGNGVKSGVAPRGRGLLDKKDLSLTFPQNSAFQDILVQVRETILYSGVEFTSDAGMTGSLVLIGCNSENANPATMGPNVHKETISETPSASNSFSFSPSTADAKRLHFRFDVGYYRMR